MSIRVLLRAMWRGVVGVGALIVLAAAVLLVVGVVRGYRPVVILTGSMGDTAPPGSVAIARPADAVELGDVLVMRPPGGPTVTHRVVDVQLDAAGTRSVVTRGDANPDVDPLPYVVGEEELVVRWVVPRVGGVLTTVRNPVIGLSLASAIALIGVAATLRRIWRSPIPVAPGCEPPGGERRTPRYAVAVATALGVIGASSGTALSLYVGVQDVTANMFSTLACYDARLGGVQTGATTVGAAGTTTVPILSVDPAHSFVAASVSSADPDPQDATVLVRFAGATELEIVRQTDSPTPPSIEVEWSVVEYDCGVTVQRGEVVGAGQSQVDVTIDPVDPSLSFALSSSVAATGATAVDGDDGVTIELLDATTLRLTTAAPMEVGSIHAWQVVTFDTDADIGVQHLSTVLPDGVATVELAVPSPVDADQTMLVVTARSATGAPDLASRSIRARLVDADTVELHRTGTAGDVDVSVQVVELRDGSTVQRGVLGLTAGEATATTAISGVQLTRSTVWSTSWQPGAASGGATTMSTDDVLGEASARLAFDDASTVRLTRDATTADASFAWQVVLWGGPNWADLDAPFRQRIDVTAGSVVTPTGYTTSLVLDHAQLVADGFSLADGSDLRLWRHNGVAWNELHRVLDEGSAWNRADTTVWFRTQEPIAATSTASYWLYFGDDAPAAPLEDPDAVWLVHEDFDDGTLGAFEDRTGGTGWYRAAPWTQRMIVSIDAASVASDLTDEVVMVRVIDPDLGAGAQADGSDIRFTTSGGAPLAHDIEEFDPATGALTAWVRLPTVSSTTATTFDLWFGAPDAPAQAEPRTTWADALAVWQLAADPSATGPGLDDEGPNQLDGIALADASLVSTVSGPAASFDGALDRFESAPFVVPGSSLSAGVWFRADTLAGETVLVAQGDPAADGAFEVSVDPSPPGGPVARARLRLGGTLVEVAGGTISTGNWHHVAMSYDGADVVLSVDGAAAASVSAAGAIGGVEPAPVVIGADPTGARALTGAIGHVHLDDDPWTATQISFRAATLAAPTTVVSAGPAIPGTWFDQGDWASRRPLTVDAGLVAGPLTDYPLLVRLVDTDLAAESQADGDDLVFTAADGVTRLDHVVESWDPVTGELIAWVRVPALDDTVDTGLFLYSANPAAGDQQDAAGVWGSEADLVLLGS